MDMLTLDPDTHLITEVWALADWRGTPRNDRLLCPRGDLNPHSP